MSKILCKLFYLILELFVHSLAPKNSKEFRQNCMIQGHLSHFNLSWALSTLFRERVTHCVDLRDKTAVVWPKNIQQQRLCMESLRTDRTKQREELQTKRVYYSRLMSNKEKVKWRKYPRKCLMVKTLQICLFLNL